MKTLSNACARMPGVIVAVGEAAVDFYQSVKKTSQRSPVKQIALALALVAGLTSFAGNAKADIVFSLLDINIPSGSSAQGFAYNNRVIYADAYQTDGSFGSIYANPPIGFFNDNLPAQIYGNGPTYNTSGKISASALDLGAVMNNQTEIAGGLYDFSSVNPIEGSSFYYGIRFSNDGSNFYNGWLQAETTSTSITFIAAAVETSANVGIIVGAVPEPSTYAMALAGIACGGFSMWRRRKRA